MAEENIVTNIVARSDFSDLIGDLNKVSSRLLNLKQQLEVTNKTLATQAAQMQKSFASTLRSTGQFSTHFVSLSSDVDKFGKSLDSGKMKLGQYYQAWQQHAKTSTGLVRDLAKQQVTMQNAILQPLGKNAQGLMQYNVNVASGLDVIKNKTAIASQEMKIMNKVIQDGANQVINWGKNTQWAGRQLSMGLTLPIAAFGKAAADAFRQADIELVRLTKVYGGVAATSAADLKKIRNEVAATAKDLSSKYGASYKDTIALAADIAATGKTGNDLLKATQETTRLSILGEVDHQTAMKATLAVQNTFKENTTQLAESINFLNAVENQTSTSLGDLIEAIPKAGPVIQAMGGSVKDLSLMLVAMKEGGIDATQGANALKSALASLVNPTKVATDMFKNFGIDLKGIVTTNAGNLTETILELQKALDKLNPLQKQQAIEQLFGKFQFARMNALFANLGKQGSQTLQVLDLMKASSQDLANIAGRELQQVTESSSGKYKRAIESLKADMAGVGEQFLNIATSIMKVIDGVIKFVGKLPEPIKTALGFVGGLVALTGPIIMLTGLLANFFGYIAKGLFHLKALIKGGEGFKLLTPEILAAQKAGSLIEETFYSDAKAASVFKLAITNLIEELNRLEAKAGISKLSAPTIATVGGNTIMQGSGRAANPSHPLIGDLNTRASAHLNPVAAMTEKEKFSQTIFGMVPNPIPVNRKIGSNPQMYMTGNAPSIERLTSMNGVSTGIVAEEAAKWHSMTGALAMQSEKELQVLKREVAATGTITSELSASYQALLPEVTQIVTMAAEETQLIISQVQAEKMTVDQARIKITELNATVEAMIAETTTAVAQTQGRIASLTTVPLTGQPVVDPLTGKSNMKEMFHKTSTAAVVDKVARALGVKTSGGGYSIETTMPKRFATGDIVPGTGNQDTVPALLTPGEFVVNKKATAQNLALLQAINGPGGSGPGYQAGGFLPATMLWQGSKMNAILAHPDQVGRRETLGLPPGNTIPGQMFADDFMQMRKKGMHPGGLLYEIGTQLGYNAKDLQFAINPMEKEIRTTLLASGDITPKQYDEIVSKIINRHISKVTRKSAAKGRYVSFLEEISSLGFQRNENNKGVLKGSVRNIGFDGQKVPQPFISTGGGIPAGMAGKHFEKIQELYPESQKTKTPEFGVGKTLKSLFGAERGHVGASLPFGGLYKNTAVGGMDPRNYSMPSHGQKAFLGMPLRKLTRGWANPRAIPRDMINAAMHRWNKGGIIKMNSGGIVSGSNVSHYAEGGPVGYTQNLKASASSIRNIGSNGLKLPQMGFGAQMGIAMGGSMIGQQVGGNTGMGIMIASNILPMISGLKMLGGQVGMLTRIGSLLGKLTIPGAIVTAIATAGIYLWKFHRHLEDIGKSNRAVFGPTKKTLEEVGLSYTSVSDKIKQVNDAIKLQKESLLSTYNSSTQSGIKGLTLTITELQDAIKKAKTDQKESVGNFNNLSNQKDVNKLAASLKEQYISAGLSVQQATNQIYVLIKASNKANMALGAISNTSFKSIVDKASAAQYSVDLMAKSIANSKANAEEMATGVANMVNSLDSYRQSLIGTKDTQGNIVDSIKAQELALEKIQKINGTDKPLNADILKSIKAQNFELGSMLQKAETLQGVYAKFALLQGGFGDKINIASLNSQQSIDAAKGMDVWAKSAANVVGTTGNLDAAYTRLGKLISTTSAQSIKLANVDYTAEIKIIDKKITSITNEANARLKLLDVQQQQQSYSSNIQKEELAYQQALTSGNMAAAAQAKINIENLKKENELTLTKQAIQDKADADIKAQELRKQKLQDQKDNAANASTKAGSASANYAQQQAALGTFKTSISGILSGLTSSTFNGDKKNAAMQLATNAIKDLKASGGSEGAKLAASYEKDLSGMLSGMLTDVNTQAHSNSLFSSAVDKFVEAINKNYDSSKVTVSPKFYNYDNPNISAYKLKEAGISTTVGTKFTDSNNQEWQITGQVNNTKFVRKVDKTKFKASGGYISGSGSTTSDSIPAMLSNGEYVVNARAVQSMGVPMLDRINRMAAGGLATRYDIPMSNKFSVGNINSIVPGSTINHMTIHASPGMDEQALANLVMVKLNNAASVRIKSNGSMGTRTI